MYASELIRDVSRALPWLAAEPGYEPIPTGISLAERTDILDSHAESLRRRYNHLYPVIDRGGHKLIAAIKEWNPDSVADPEGKGAESLEKSEAYFHTQRGDLHLLREALIEAGASHDHDVFRALDRLDGLFAWIIATMQEIRWAVLIADGKRAPPSKRRFTFGSALVAALDE